MTQTLGHTKGPFRRRILGRRDDLPARLAPCSPGGVRRGCAATSCPTSCWTRSSARTPRTPSPGCPARTAPSRCWPRSPRSRLDGATGFGCAAPAAGDPVGLGGPRGRSTPPPWRPVRPSWSRERSRPGAVARRRRDRLGGAPGPATPAPRRRRGRPRAALGAARLREPAGRARRRPLASRGRRRADEPAAPTPGDRPARHPRSLPRPGRPRPAGDDDRRPRPRRRRRRPERRTRSSSGATRCAPLDRAGRRALVAACSPEVWPPPDSGSQ